MCQQNLLPLRYNDANFVVIGGTGSQNEKS